MNDKFVSKTIKTENLLMGIHGLRGVAAIAIVMFHLHYMAALPLPDAFYFIHRDFGFAVHLFFVLSAFSLMYSTESRLQIKGWCRDYFIRRLLRIAPLFYAVLSFELARQYFNGGVQESIHSIILNLSFTTGFVPFSEIVWGGWSVSVEMIFYALFPVIILICRMYKAALLFMFLSILVSFSLRDMMDAMYSKVETVAGLSWAYYAFAPNFYLFVMGIFAYRVSQRITADSVLIRFVIPGTAILLLVFLALGAAANFNYSGRLDIIIWGLAFTMLVIWQAVAPIKLVANRFLEYVGERSFSVYLLHTIVIYFNIDLLVKIYAGLSVYFGSYAYFVCAALTVAAILVVAEITYRLIEVPGINIGRKWIKRLQSAQPGEASAI